MRLLFDEGSDVKPRPRLKLFIERVFELACEELGIANCPDVVCVSFKSADRPLLGGGSACTDMRKREQAETPIQMTIKARDHAGAFFLAFLHEMWHVRQLVSGDFLVKDTDPKEASVKTMQVIFKGVPMAATTLLRYKRWAPMWDPAEAEAYGGQVWLYERVRARLCKADQDYMGPVPEHTNPTILRNLRAHVLRAILWPVAVLSLFPFLMKTKGGRALLLRVAVAGVLGAATGWAVGEVLTALLRV